MNITGNIYRLCFAGKKRKSVRYKVLNIHLALIILSVSCLFLKRIEEKSDVQSKEKKSGWFQLRIKPLVMLG